MADMDWMDWMSKSEEKHLMGNLNLEFLFNMFINCFMM